MNAALVLAIATHLLVWYVPGIVLLLLAGARPGIALGAAPLMTLGVVTASTTVADVVPLPWSPWTFLLAIGLAAGVVLLARVLGGTQPGRCSPRRPRRCDPGDGGTPRPWVRSSVQVSWVRRSSVRAWATSTGPTRTGTTSSTPTRSATSPTPAMPAPAASPA